MADQIHTGDGHSLSRSRVQPKYDQREQHHCYCRRYIRGVHYTIMSTYSELVHDHRVRVVRAAFVLLQHFVPVHYFEVPFGVIRESVHLELSDQNYTYYTLQFELT